MRERNEKYPSARDIRTSIFVKSQGSETFHFYKEIAIAHFLSFLI